jgi:hypothetical protein
MSRALKSGVQGGALAAFSVSGYVEGTSSLRSAPVHQKDAPSGEFAPMTPHTRRQATAAISSITTADRLATIHGGIKVIPLPPSDKAVSDESLALWVGGHEHVAVVPGIARFWESQLRKGSTGNTNIFSGGQPTKMVKLHDLATGLLGERCCGLALLAGSSRPQGNDRDGGIPIDVLVRGETRLVVVREGEDGPGKKIGGVTNVRRKVLSESRSNAIIVHGTQPRNTSTSFNLSTVKPGTLRQKPSVSYEDEILADARQPSKNGQAGLGFDFTDTLNAAADVTDANISRDVDAEMLDIMGLDQALERLDDSRGTGRKKGLFEED